MAMRAVSKTVNPGSSPGSPAWTSAQNGSKETRP